MFTARFEQDRKVTKKWLKTHKVPYHRLILDKPQYDIFIDDKAWNSFNDLPNNIFTN